MYNIPMTTLLFCSAVAGFCASTANFHPSDGTLISAEMLA